MEYEDLLLEKKDMVATITLNAPDKLNAHTMAMMRNLSLAVDEVAKDDDIRAVIITGAGRAFCAGADIKSPELASGDAVLHMKFVRCLCSVLERIENLDQPVIAAINGLALAGGLELVMACDLAIASDTAQVGDQHANYGLVPGGGGSQRLPRLIGIRKAKQFLF